MKKTAFIIVFILAFSSTISHAGFWDELLKELPVPAKGNLNEGTIISGLKEALSVGADKAVKKVSMVDGYFGSQLIKILMPEKMKKVAEVLGKIGFQREVDEFVLSMNRAAEKAAPEALSFFVDAIKGMTFEDAKNILNGGDTAATEFFRTKTYDRIYKAFKPVVSEAMNEVGVTRQYKQLMGKYDSVPFVDKQSLDLDHHVTTKTIDGLFYMIGEEEKKIRTDPAARVTELLKKVFGDRR